MNYPSTGGGAPAPDSPFPLHPFDPEPPGPGRTGCRAWRAVSGGNRQHCPYAQADPVHLDSARTRVDPDSGELVRSRPMRTLAHLEQFCQQLREAGHGDDTTIWATLDDEVAPDRHGCRPVRTLGGFSTPEKAAESQAMAAISHG